MRTKRILAWAVGALMTLALCFTLLPRAAYAASYDVLIGGSNLSGQTGIVYLKSDGSVAGANLTPLSVFQYDPTGSRPRLTLVGDDRNVAVEGGYHTSDTMRASLKEKHENYQIRIN